jgi:hypothetical protein
VTVKLLLAAMEKNPGKKFLIDGFPRSMDNKDGWFQVVGDKAEVAFCLFYDCPEEELEKRLLKRGETSGRDDDNIESIKKRFRTFKETSMPVVEWFEGRGQLRKVSSAQSVEDVWSATQRIFDEAGVKSDAPACKVITQVCLRAYNLVSASDDDDGAGGNLQLREVRRDVPGDGAAELAGGGERDNNQRGADR